MHVEQLYDKGLAHASYAILSAGKIALVDPGRDPQPYYDFAASHNATIVAVIETHPHADFVSSHLEIAQTTDATIYASTLLGGEYPYRGFDDGDVIALGNVTLHAMNTPGHSPDSICVLLRDEKGRDNALFSGDTLFIGDVGRPDLRENVGNIHAKREELARAMYHSIHDRLLKLADDVLVYPAHGAGSLCGKNLSSDLSSTIGNEKIGNYALQPMTEDEFVVALLDGQPFIPKYFGHDVNMNKKGAPSYAASLSEVKRASLSDIPAGALVIDARPDQQFKAGHREGAINLQNGGKFETWLGSVVGGDEKYYLVAESEPALNELIRKTAKIGYEVNIAGAVVAASTGNHASAATDLVSFRANPDAYTIVDIRNHGEYADGAIFASAISIPLPELRERASEIPTGKPIMIHCAAGYRSAAGASIVEAAVKGKAPVHDLSEAIKGYM